jgi:hypothetical protein
MDEIKRKQFSYFSEEELDFLEEILKYDESLSCLNEDEIIENKEKLNELFIKIEEKYSPKEFSEQLIGRAMGLILLQIINAIANIMTHKALNTEKSTKKEHIDLALIQAISSLVFSFKAIINVLSDNGR